MDLYSHCAFFGGLWGEKYLFLTHLDGNFQPQQQPDGLVAGSVDLVTMLLKVRYTSVDIHPLFSLALGFPVLSLDSILVVLPQF